MYLMQQCFTLYQYALYQLLCCCLLSQIILSVFYMLREKNLLTKITFKIRGCLGSRKVQTQPVKLAKVRVIRSQNYWNFTILFPAIFTTAVQSTSCWGCNHYLKNKNKYKFHESFISSTSVIYETIHEHMHIY